MSDDTTPQETIEPTNSDFTNSSVYKHMAKEIKSLRKQNEDTASAQKAASELAEQDELKKRGEHEKVIATQDAKLKALEEAYSKSALDNAMKFELMKLGVSDELILAGAIALYDGDIDGVPEYAAKKAEGRATLKNKIDPPRNVNPATNSKKDNINEQLASGDREAQKKRFQEMLSGG